MPGVPVFGVLPIPGVPVFGVPPMPGVPVLGVPPIPGVPVFGVGIFSIQVSSTWKMYALFNSSSKEVFVILGIEVMWERVCLTGPVCSRW
jgi:hypothetical protein